MQTRRWPIERTHLTKLIHCHVHPPVSYRIFVRAVHSSQTTQSAPASLATPAELSAPPISPTKSPASPRKPPPLANLPLIQVLRTYFVTTLSASPRVFDACLAILNRLLASKNPITSIERNPLLRWILKKTFYAQFCAGENRAEVFRAVQNLRQQGYQGVMLEYALEVLKPKVGEKAPSAESVATKRDIEKWRKGMMETVEMAAEGDFIGLKWSGLGTLAFTLLKANKPPTPLMLTAMHEVCDAAAAKNVGILPGAEEDSTNDGIDAWTMTMQEQYNALLRPEETQSAASDQQVRQRAPTGQAIVYTTYQCLLRSTPPKISRHLAAARTNNHVLGVKLVRGAYLAFEPASGVWPNIEETHSTYDNLVDCLLRRKWGGKLQPCHGVSGRGQEDAGFPEVDVFLATHNATSVRKAVTIRKEQSSVAGQDKTASPAMAIAQLSGMADELGAELLDECKTNFTEGDACTPRPIKCATWGSLEDCLGFLLRRAAENRDAAGRTEDSRRAMGGELWRRCKTVVGM